MTPLSGPPGSRSRVDRVQVPISPCNNAVRVVDPAREAYCGHGHWSFSENDGLVVFGLVGSFGHLKEGVMGPEADALTGALYHI